MLITIYDKVGNAKVDLSPNDSSTQETAIQGDNVLTLSFTHYEYIDLDIDDYADFEGKRYWLTEKYRPKQKSTKEWSYDIKLYGAESMIKRLLVIKTVDNEEQPVFTLTAPPREHVAMIVHCMNDGMGDITDWKVGQVDGTENIVIDYFGKYCDQALKEIAEKVGAEWWVEGKTVNICKCEHGEPVYMGYDKGLTGIEPMTADNVDFYTRLYPVGSSRNVDREKYGHSRLQLPGGQKYIEMNADKYGRVDHYEADAFADIYPRRTGVVSSVRSEVRTGEDGKLFTIYYFRDDSLPFNPNDYEIGGLVKHVSFQEGSELAGLGDEEDGTYYFEVNYNSDTGEFEIITIWPYDDDTQLPGGTLVPKTGDKYILWNLRMPDEYYALAEEEFLTAVNKYNADHNLDLTVYKASTDHVWIEDNGVELSIGRRVRLESEEYFPEFGYRDSRITRITRKVSLPSQMDIEIGDALSRTSMQRMSDSVNDAKSYARSIGESTALPDIIRTWDKTVPTDNNLFSSRRSQKEFISRVKPDSAKEKITFEKGLESGTYAAGASGARIGAEGNAELADLILRGLLSSAKFADGFTGAGWRIWLADGLSRLTIDELTVRKAMHVFELLIERIRAVGGQICVSASNGKIAEVEESGTWYRISFEQQPGFAAGDLIRCQTFTGTTLKSYWVGIDDTDPGGSVRIAKSEFEGQSAPAPGDECVLMGNATNAARQSLILISATGDGKPRIDVLDGVKSKSFAGCLRARLGALDGITDAAFGDDQPAGHGLYSDNVYLRGRFVLTSGEEVLTRFAVTEGKITSAVDSLRSDVDAPGNFISNPMLAGGAEGWKKLTEESLPGAETPAATVRDDGTGRPVLYLNGSGVTQERADMRGEPEDYPVGADGRKQAVPVYLSLLVRSAAGGTLSGGLYRTLREGFETRYATLNFERQIAASVKYVPVTVRGLWNGEGALWLRMEGAAEIYAVTLTQDRLATRYSTLFEQSDKLVKISAANFNDDGSVKQESSIATTAEGISLGVREKIDGALKETGIDIESGKIELKSDNVTFTDSEGNVQAFIEGGKINAKAIDAAELTAEKLEMYEKNADGTRAAHPTVRITPESKGMSILDKETGGLCQEFSGASHTGKEDFFGTGSGGAVSMTHSGGGVTVNGTATAPGGSDTETELAASAVFHTDGAATVRITSGKIQAYAKAADAEITPSPGELVPVVWSTAEAEIVLLLRGYSDAACTVMTDEWEIASVSALSQSRRDLSVEDDGTGGSASGTYTYTAEEKYGGADCAGRSVTTRGAGYFRLWLVYRVRATKAGSEASVKYGYYVGPALAAEYVTEVYVSRFFANGFCLGRRKDDYVAVMLGADGMRLEARNGSGGLRMTPEGGAEVLVAADATSEHWAPLPRPLYRCDYTWNASSGGYIPKYSTALCIGGEYAAPQSTATGKVELTVPALWTQIAGGTLADRLRVRVEGRNTARVYGAVTGISGNKIYVSLQNQSGAADGSFRLEVDLL